MIARPGDSKELSELCERLAPGGQAPEPMQARPFAWGVEQIPKDCFGNVNRVIALRGGTCELGWKLYEFPAGVVLHAEFHAVWVNRAGARRDVTPPELPGLDEALFLPDPLARYEGEQVDSHRVALVDDPLVREHIELQQRQFEILNRGDRAQMHGDLRLPTGDTRVMRRAEEAEKRVMKRYLDFDEARM